MQFKLTASCALIFLNYSLKVNSQDVIFCCFPINEVFAQNYLKSLEKI